MGGVEEEVYAEMNAAWIFIGLFAGVVFALAIWGLWKITRVPESAKKYLEKRRD